MRKLPIVSRTETCNFPPHLPNLAQLFLLWLSLRLLLLLLLLRFVECAFLVHFLCVCVCVCVLCNGTASDSNNSREIERSTHNRNCLFPFSSPIFSRWLRDRPTDWLAGTRTLQCTRVSRAHRRTGSRSSVEVVTHAQPDGRLFSPGCRHSLTRKGNERHNCIGATCTLCALLAHENSICFQVARPLHCRAFAIATGADLSFSLSGRP